ncbi:MAG: hypothetical protein EP344_07320 [Bacteroidetes bacterium]|nr:MAG: hypothetical protein EP344_07320 [Bacteroidota bacterium]
MKNSFLLYGAYGYTGRLIARMARQYNLQPVLAGRREAPLAEMQKQLDLPYRVIDLEQSSDLEAALQDVPVVLHAAGPFLQTATPMMEACLRTGTHYLDITGEIAVFEQAKSQDAQARKSGIMLLPGVGFDVVPTDCLALYLKNQMPNAIALKLAFATKGGGLSHGTAATLLQTLGQKGSVRKNGSIRAVPIGHKGMWVDFGKSRRFVITIPWGDISTAYTSTGIPDIETYFGATPFMYQALKFQWLYNWLFRTAFMQKQLLGYIKRQPAGPSDEQRARGHSMVWGEVRDQKGNTCQARLNCPEGYTYTAHASLMILNRILKGDWKPGYQTPAGCYGPDLALQIPGVKRELLDQAPKP